MDVVKESIVNIPREIINDFETVFDRLFVPDMSAFDEVYDNLVKKIPFIEMIKEDNRKQQIVKDIFTNLGEVVPSVTLKFSETPLSKFGVKDMTLTFDWFEPYRENIHNLMSAVIVTVFAFNQLFAIANIVNGVGSGVDVHAEAVNKTK